jgi:hypothetical protein
MISPGCGGLRIRMRYSYHECPLMIILIIYV